MTVSRANWRVDSRASACLTITSETLPRFAGAERVSKVDLVVSGLPWAVFSDRDQTELLDTTIERMGEGARFATFAYLQGLLLPAGKRFRRKLDSRFREVETSRTVWRNLPPAVVYRCRR